ncbi:hypothetical protein H6F89_04660 [Cyanobacteria bacterium FACHB-63]|nr:hypothetical protein [Cyanobacteria bacterium FACHB-63]
MTGSAFEEDRVTALSAGCDDFVRKPVHAAVIFEKMAEHLGIRYCYAEEALSQAQSVPQTNNQTALQAANLPPASLTSSDFQGMSID